MHFLIIVGFLEGLLENLHLTGEYLAYCNITCLLVRNKQMNNKSYCKMFLATQAPSRMGELHHDSIRGLENMKGI